MAEHDLSAGGDVMTRVRGCARDALAAYGAHPAASVELINVSENWEKPEPKSGTFTLDGKTCGKDGSGEKRDKGTNVRKNRTDIPADSNVGTIDRLGPMSGSYTPQLAKIRSATRRGRSR